MKKLGYLMAMLLCMSACKPAAQKNEKPILMVTLEPLGYFAEAVAGDCYEVVGMVPKGVSPETYDHTP
jgi:zinc transport system substrate-binding protein